MAPDPQPRYGSSVEATKAIHITAWNSTHDVPPEMSVQNGIPRGRVMEFTMNSSDSKVYPGIARDPSTSGTIDPANPAKLVVTTSHPAPYTRRVSVYVPKQYVPGSVAPFMVGADGPDPLFFSAVDTLIAQHVGGGEKVVHFGGRVWTGVVVTLCGIQVKMWALESIEGETS